jgi:tripartite-type tricarboxylate transporter receptor subunit TctC
MLEFRTLGVMLCWMVLICPEPAAAQTDYYKGKQLTVFVNFAPGGPTDIEGRLFARSIAKHIAGRPNIILRNMEGAGGLTGATYLGEIAPKDGTFIGYFSSVPWIYSILPGQRRLAFDTFNFVAYQPGTAIHYMRTDVKPGIKNVDQLLTAQDIVVGGLSQNNAKDVMMRLSLDLLGVKYKYVTSYPGSQGVRLALQRGEVNYYSESPATYRQTIQPMVQKGEVIPLYYDPGYFGGKFTMPKQMEGLDIPSYDDVFRKLKGADPSGIRWQSYLAAIGVNNATQRLIVMPPNAPAEAVKELQRAINEMQIDPIYIEEATKAFGYVPEYVADAETNGAVRRMLQVSPDVTEFMQKFMETR